MFSFLAKPYIVFNFTACAVHLFSLKKIIIIYHVVEKAVFSQAGQKHPDARRAKSRGMRRTLPYVAMTEFIEVLSQHCKAFIWITYVTLFANRSTKDERNTADGCFSTAC
jgi:hypothetical protein